MNELQLNLLLILLVPFITTLFLGMNYLGGFFWQEINLIRYTRTSLTLGLLLSISLFLIALAS